MEIKELESICMHVFSDFGTVCWADADNMDVEVERVWVHSLPLRILLFELSVLCGKEVA